MTTQGAQFPVSLPPGNHISKFLPQSFLRCHLTPAQCPSFGWILYLLWQKNTLVRNTKATQCLFCLSGLLQSHGMISDSNQSLQSFNARVLQIRKPMPSYYYYFLVCTRFTWNPKPVMGPTTRKCLALLHIFFFPVLTTKIKAQEKELKTRAEE